MRGLVLEYKNQGQVLVGLTIAGISRKRVFPHAIYLLVKESYSPQASIGPAFVVRN